SEKFNRALVCLEDNYKHLITKEFLEKENNYWYEEFYSKTTYYKYRKNAVNEFLAYYLDKDQTII
ncbi:MG284/MPN403 family protein, partial [Mycoplasmopsis bovis]|uniref:MG284/MPN403 family protein n=1 Tax=Mycoplasmopsis bovis TaxID=28903 RepID=UPI003D2E37A5